MVKYSRKGVNQVNEDQIYADIYEELAMLYMHHQDLSGKTPGEIYQMFRSAYDEIRNAEKARLDAEERRTHEYV